MRRVDLDALLDRIDVNDLVRRIDMDGLVAETDLGAVIARSSGGAASEALDLARSQAVGLDQFVDRWVRRGCCGVSVLDLRAGRPAERPGASHEHPGGAAGWVSAQGHYAGSVSRLLAFILDVLVSAGLFRPRPRGHVAVRLRS